MGREIMGRKIIRLNDYGRWLTKIMPGLIFLFLCLSWPNRAEARVEFDVGAADILTPSELEYYLKPVEQKMSEGDTAAALAVVAEGLVRYPYDPRLLERRADILATLPYMRPQAADLYRTLLFSQPDNLAIKVKLANTYLALRQPFEAEALFQEVLAVDPANGQANLGLGRLYLAMVFYPMAARHFDRARASLPGSQAALEGWWEASSLITPQIQTLAAAAEDSDAYRRGALWTGLWLYLHPKVRFGTGYGSINYHSSSIPFLSLSNKTGQTVHRHVVPIAFRIRPTSRVFLEAGGALNDYGRFGQSGSARAAVYWQAAVNTGVSLAYSYYDALEYFGPFLGPWGQYFDDFSRYNRYRYRIANPTGLWAHTTFGTLSSNTLAVTRKIKVNEIIPWGYYTFREKVTLIGLTSLGSYSDGNFRRIHGGSLQYLIRTKPLLKLRYSFYFIHYTYNPQEVSGPGASSAYNIFQNLKNHSWGVVLEKNWAGRVKLALESNITYNQRGNIPGFNAMAEFDYLLTYHVSLRLAGFYANTPIRGPISYQERVALTTLSYRF
jgi:tetratricopeptide (TPR) repeat protein